MELVIVMDDEINEYFSLLFLFYSHIETNFVKGIRKYFDYCPALPDIVLANEGILLLLYSSRMETHGYML